jgi:hypothetical protein
MRTDAAAGRAASTGFEDDGLGDGVAGERRPRGDAVGVTRTGDQAERRQLGQGLVDQFGLGAGLPRRL